MSLDVSIAAFQNDLGFKLNSESFFANINVQLERKELYSSEVALATVWQTVKGGASGVGIVVAMAEINIEDAEAPGPELLCLQKFSVLEEPNINQTAGTGTQIFAEDIGVYLIRLLNGYALAQDITLWAQGRAMVPNRDYPGVRGVDVQLQYRFTPNFLAPCATVPISFDAGQCMLTCATEGATIYYTTDGTFPGAANAAAQIYTVPFNIASGKQVRAAAYQPGTLVGSSVWTEVAP